MALLKDQKDPTSPASYCPISLLNVDFTSLPSRVNSFIANYMDTNQVGFITGRELRDNTHKAFNIWHHAKISHIITWCCKSLRFLGVPFSIDGATVYGVWGQFFTGFICAFHSPYSDTEDKWHLQWWHLYQQGRKTRVSTFTWCLCACYRTLIRPSELLLPFMESSLVLLSWLFFADVMSSFLTDPDSLLPALQSHLTGFIEVSGLRLNQLKTIAFPVNLTQSEIWGLWHTYQYSWEMKSVKYLSTVIPSFFENMH